MRPWEQRITLSVEQKFIIRLVSFARSLLNWKANSGEDVQGLWAWVRENNIDLDSGEDDWKKVKVVVEHISSRAMVLCNLIQANVMIAF